MTHTVTLAPAVLLLAGLVACSLPIRRQPPAGADGAMIYEFQQCANCHGASGEGSGELGPRLSELSAYWTRETLADFLVDPLLSVESDPRLSALHERYSGNMYGYANLSEGERLTLADWLLGL